MTTQAIQDIKEFVGEMPARGCEFRSTSMPMPCGREAQWIDLGHDGRALMQCEWIELYLCGSCLARSLAICESWIGSTCNTCPLIVTSASDILGPVMPL